MVLVEATNLRGRARLPVAAIVLMALATAWAGASAGAQTMDDPSTAPPNVCNIFMLDRGRYTTIDLPCQTPDIKSSSTTAARSRVSSSIPPGAFTVS
jgi:hypothetical protein